MGQTATLAATGPKSVRPPKADHGPRPLCSLVLSNSTLRGSPTVNGSVSAPEQLAKRHRPESLVTDAELEELINDCPTLYHMAEQGSWRGSEDTELDSEDRPESALIAF